MLDLETLGTSVGSVITSIGAVSFGGGEIKDEFYAKINPKSCVKHGMTMNPDTVLWWLDQNDDSRKEIVGCKNAKSIEEVLSGFSEWCRTFNDNKARLFPSKDIEVWGNGATFDNVLISDAYDRVGFIRPWSYAGDRCYRTIKNLRPDIEIERTGTHHNALEDAKSQAIHLMKLSEVLGLQI